MVRPLLSLGSQSERTIQGLSSWQRWAPGALIALTLVGLLLFMDHRGYDDPYITFRYASNLLSGHGFVYNIGQRTLSTTAPFYALILAGLGLFWADLPAVSGFVSAVTLALGAIFLYAWAQGRGERAVGMLAALLLCLWPSLILTFGAETCLYLMFIVGGLWAYDRSRFGLTAGTLALATMVRPDGVLAAFVLGFYHLIRRRPIPWRAFWLYGSLVGLFYGSLWLYFGSPLPVTLQAKQQQAQLAASVTFGHGFLELVRQYARQPLFWLHGVLALVGLGRVVIRASHWWPLLLWTAAYFLAFSLLGVSRYSWYYAPLALAFVVMVAEGATTLVRSVARTKLPRSLTAGLAGMLMLALLAPLINSTVWIGWHPDPRVEVYGQIGRWLKAHTPLQSSVGALEVGIIGYNSQRRMIDFAGLIQPDVAQQLTPSTTYQDSAAWAIRTYEPDYVVLHQNAFSGLSASDWFQASYLPVQDYASSRAGLAPAQEILRLTLYQRRAKP